ncbi:MAG: gliding motility-associated protein GldE [Roseivirga sp.]
MSNTLDFYFCLIDGVVLVALLSGSAVISGTEAAFFSLSHKQITQFRNTHGPREKRVLQLLQHPRRLLGTILILNNLINVAFVTFSTYLLWKIVGTENVDHFIVLVYTFTSTIFIVLFGEVIPKIYATQNNLYWARHMAGFLTLAVPLLRPLSSLLLRVGSLFGKNLLQKRHDLSIDELSRALELTTTNGTSEGEKEILRGVVNFSSLAAKQIMQPRTEIKALDTAINFHQLMDLINKSVHSRFPVYRDTIDNIEGVLHTKDLLAHLDEDENFSWQTLLRKCLFVPENKKIDALLLDFQEKRVRMAIVVDEYGGTSGLITLEDIVEEIIGDITDEFNQDTALYQQLNDHTFVMESKISLNDFCKVVGESPTTFAEVKGESESLGGLLLELNGRLPHASEKISFQEFTFTIMAADTRKIKKVKVEITPDQEEVPQAN